MRFDAGAPFEAAHHPKALSEGAARGIRFHCPRHVLAATAIAAGCRRRSCSLVIRPKPVSLHHRLPAVFANPSSLRATIQQQCASNR